VAEEVETRKIKGYNTIHTYIHIKMHTDTSAPYIEDFPMSKENFLVVRSRIKAIRRSTPKNFIDNRR